MARPNTHTTMARSAVAAFTAAIEAYNKPNSEYREQTFALLIVNAWETLLKARIIQQRGGDIRLIYRRESDSRKYVRDEFTREPLTINLSQSLAQVDVPQEVRKNINGLTLVRNQAAHLGFLSFELRQSIQQFGTASVNNFIDLASTWFGEKVNVPHLIPIGFMGEVQITKGHGGPKQRDLLRRLSELTQELPHSGSHYAVALNLEVTLNPKYTGGGSIGPTNDPNAPLTRLTDDEALARYPASYSDLTTRCALRYRNFKQNQHFNDLMRKIKEDANCAHQRKLDPRNDASSTKVYYNLEFVFEKLDEEYEMSV